MNDLMNAEKAFLGKTKLTRLGALANMVNGNYVKQAWNDTDDPGTHSLAHVPTHLCTYSSPHLITRGTGEYSRIYQCKSRSYRCADSNTRYPSIIH